MTRFIFLGFLIYVALACNLAKANDSEVLIELRGTYALSRFAVGESSKASYSGFEYGGSLISKFKSKQKYGLAGALTYEVRSQNNSANEGSTTEKLEGSVIGITGRLYALNLYLGAGVVYTSFSAKYTTASTTTTTPYTGLGFRTEAGLEHPLSKYWYVAPRVQFDIVNAQTQTNGYKRLNTFGLGVSLGIRF